jgi:hypothetical protein
VSDFAICMVIDSHTWAQTLPLSNNTLVCLTCDAKTPMGQRWTGDSCAKRFADQRGYKYVG